MKAEIFEKEFTELKKKISIPNNIVLWIQSIIRSHFRLEEKVESLETSIKILRGGK